ncbi:hypothetical protein FDX20_26770, partial [Citrobacter sp. TBCS-11]
YFNLYGPGYNQNDYDSDKSKYYGSFPSESIPNVIQGSYGLVWDSEELSGGVGPYYLETMYGGAGAEVL